jgi:small-conductance mechanosensitive channel
MFDPQLIYTVVVTLLGALLLVKTVYQLRQSTQRRKQRLSERERSDAVPAHPPTGDPHRIAKERGLSSIEDHFTVTRRMVVPMIVGITAAAVAVPYLSNVPGAFVSLTVAAVTVVVGVALKPFVENAIAGLIISFSKLINLGDTLLIGTHYGTVEDITTTHTTIKLWDWRRHVLPNSKMLQTEFTNYSLFDRDIWAHVTFWISYDADLERVREIALDCPTTSSHFAGNEPPSFWVMAMEREGIQCWVAAWARSPSSAWMLAHDIRTELALGFRRHGISTHGYRHTFADSPGSLVDDFVPA